MNDLDRHEKRSIMATISAEVFVDSDITYTPWTDGYSVGFRAERKDGRVEYIYLSPISCGGDIDEVAENPVMYLNVGSTAKEETDSCVDFRMFCERYKSGSDPLDKETIEALEARRNHSSNGKGNEKIVTHPWAVRTEGRDHYVHFPYDEAFLEVFKKKIPPNRRWWDKFKREWRIDPDWLDGVEKLLQTHFG